MNMCDIVINSSNNCFVLFSIIYSFKLGIPFMGHS